ncbi:MAG: TadE/TadG family type IV pilus assembly protein [Pirellulaceae bacterium]
MEDVWLIWLASCGVLSLLVARSLRSLPWSAWSAFWRDERGASYALSYLMTFPFYLMIVCWVIQSTMILIVKIGVMHSAHMAARSAVVWRSADPSSNQAGQSLAEDKARQAAALTLTPFASGLDAHQYIFAYTWDAPSRLPGAIGKSVEYELLYRQLAKHSEAKDCLADSAFVRRKFIYASVMTNVTLTAPRNRFNEPLSAEVRFRMPVHIPGTGWILGTLHPSRKGFYRDVRATATLPLETPDTPDGLLGIEYDPSQL